MKKLLSVFCALTLLASIVPVAHAGSGCYVDPVLEYSGTGTIKSAVYMRSEACISNGTVVLRTLSAGTMVEVKGYTDGWFEVVSGGKRGWIGQQFLQNNAQPTGTRWDNYVEYRSSLPPETTSGDLTGADLGIGPATFSDPVTLSRTKGYILLQVEAHGEAWYVDPITEKRYYMKDGPTAYQMMRSFGLGVSEKDYESIQAGNLALKSRLEGRIILRAQAHGEAYYIHPKDLKVYYLQNGDEAYRVMRLYSLGITDNDLLNLAEATIPVK